MGIIRSEITENPATIDEKQVDDLDRMLSEIDSEVVVYLNDPENNPPPAYERLIAQIQSIPERKDYSKALSLKITNLKYRAYYYNRSWQQIRDNVAQSVRDDKKYKRRQESYYCAPSVKEKETIEKKGGNTVEILYEIQKKKWDKYQLTASEELPETKKEFKERIIKQYQTLQNKKDKNTKLVLTWNKAAKRCDLIVDRRNKD
jgi:hypothetical protein